MKYGFIGTGNICYAVITGAVKGGVSCDQIEIYDIDATKTEKLSRETGVASCLQEKIISDAEIIFLGLKPNVLPNWLRENAAVLARRKDVPTVVSFAASVNIDSLNALLPGTPIIRVMPNLNSAIGAGMSAICANALCDEHHIFAVTKFMSACGGTTTIDEQSLDIFTVLAGSSPAFAYLFIDSLARAALSLGLPKAQALEIAAQSVFGSAKMLLESDEHPWELVDRVCSPGGITIEGIRALQEGGFEHTVMQAVIRAVKK
jgi:pyrroline-5-carboxylate reductase